MLEVRLEVNTGTQQTGALKSNRLSGRGVDVDDRSDTFSPSNHPRHLYDG